MGNFETTTDAEICAAAIDNLGCREASVYEYDADRGDRRHWFALSVRYDKVWLFVGQRHFRAQLLKLARTCRRPEIVSAFPPAPPLRKAPTSGAA